MHYLFYELGCGCGAGAAAASCTFASFKFLRKGRAREHDDAKEPTIKSIPCNV